MTNIFENWRKNEQTGAIRMIYGYEPKDAKEVGDCYACGGTIYDYEAVKCGDCGNMVHKDCIKKCKCGHEACRKCMIQNKDTLEYSCGQECEDE